MTTGPGNPTENPAGTLEHKPVTLQHSGSTLLPKAFNTFEHLAELITLVTQARARNRKLPGAGTWARVLPKPKAVTRSALEC